MREHRTRYVGRRGATNAVEALEIKYGKCTGKDVRNNPRNKYITIDMTDIPFICGGTFDGLETVAQCTAQS